ncbi:MAG: amino acid ABC transporter permease [Leptolyngbya sp. SIO1E4]|nr:amino acid ABC transporter permease [Leptolyngbya sp. SIO1E4]
MDYRFQFQVIWQNLDLLVLGVWLTFKLSALATVLGLCVGMLGAIARISGNWLLQAIATGYVEAIRNTPFLVQLLFIFFGISTLGPKLGADQAALLALTINFGAYATEIIRGGILGIQQGQIEAGMSLGFKRLQVFRHIVLPPAIATIYPALTSQVVLLMLLSSVVSQISAEELTFTGNFLRSRTFRDFEVYLAIALIYAVLALSLKLIAHLLQKRLFRFQRYL